MGIHESTTVKDANWVRQAFFKRGGNRGVGKSGLGGAGTQSADINSSFNYYDTTLGGNRVLNPPPQYCRFSDPKVNTITPGCKSMGQGYMEAIDNNAQRISLQFGIPKYNSMTSFMSSFYDAKQAAMVKFGQVGEGFFYNVGKGIGVLFTLPLQTFFGINHLINRISSAISGNPYSKFYYMQPTMALYWNAVALMFNKLAVDMGVMDPVEPAEIKDGKLPVYTSPSKLETLRRMLPDVVLGDAGKAYIDVKSIASRSQRLANAFNDQLIKIEEDIDKSGLRGTAARDEYYAKLKALRGGQTLTDEGYTLYDDYMSEYAKSPIGTGQDQEASNERAIKEAIARNTGAEVKTDEPPERSIWTSFEALRKYMRADLQEGSAFVSFHVDKTGPISHSFSNTTKEAPLKETANGIAQTARDLTVNMFGGNIGDNALVNFAESVAGSLGDLATGALSSIGLGIEGALSGAMMDMSDVYDDSSAEISSQDYTMTFATPYGNKYSILTRVYLPLCCILAGALPRRTGKNSYHSPFLCRLHSQAFEEVRLGVISNVNIELGVSNIGRQIDNLPTAIKVTMQVESMDKMMTIPLSDSVLNEVLSFSAFDEDTTFSDFLSTLAGTSLYDQYFMVPRLKRAWKKTVQDWNTFSSPTYFSQWFAGTMGGRAISAFLKAGDI